VDWIVTVQEAVMSHVALVVKVTKKPLPDATLVPIGKTHGIGVDVLVNVLVGVFVAVLVKVGLAVAVGVLVLVPVEVTVGVLVGMAVPVEVAVAVDVLAGEAVEVLVAEAVVVAVGVLVMVPVEVTVGVFVAGAIVGVFVAGPVSGGWHWAVSIVSMVLPSTVMFFAYTNGTVNLLPLAMSSVWLGSYQPPQAKSRLVRVVAVPLVACQ
jgi:hypothetical protein